MSAEQAVEIPLTKTSEKILKRPLKRSLVYKEVVEQEVIINICIGFCKGRKFRAMSKFNKICPQCKQSERWRDY